MAITMLMAGTEICGSAAAHLELIDAGDWWQCGRGERGEHVGNPEF